MQDKPMARISLPLHSLLKNAEVADFLSLLNASSQILKLLTRMQLIEIWLIYKLPTVPVINSPPSCPTVREHSYQVMELDKEITPPWNEKFCKPAFFKKSAFSCSLLCPQFIKVAKWSQTPSQCFLSSALPPLCLSISLIKSSFSGISSSFLS